MNPDSAPISSQQCPRCGRPNQCGMASGGAACWCMSEPIAAITTSAKTASCYCRDCLRELVEPAAQLHKPSIPR